MALVLRGILSFIAFLVVLAIVVCTVLAAGALSAYAALRRLLRGDLDGHVH